MLLLLVGIAAYTSRVILKLSERILTVKLRIYIEQFTVIVSIF